MNAFPFDDFQDPARVEITKCDDLHPCAQGHQRKLNTGDVKQWSHQQRILLI